MSNSNSFSTVNENLLRLGGFIATAPTHLLIYGCGAMARVLHSYIERDPRYKIVGFTVDDDLCNMPFFCGLPFVPWSRASKIFSPLTHKMITAVGYVKMNAIREQKHIEGCEKGYAFTSYVHPSVSIPDSVRIGKNSVILDYSTIHAGTYIGDGVFIASNTNIGHDCRINDYCWINSGCSVGGGSQLGASSFLGVGACVADSANVRRKSFLGANVIVSGETRDGEVWLPEKPVLHPMSSEQFVEVFK